MNSTRFHPITALASLSVFVSLLLITGCGGGNGNNNGNNQTPSIATKFRQTNLVSDTAGVAAVTDPNLINPWGIAFSPNGPFWIADNNSGKATLYDGSGAIQPLVVNIPTPTAATGGTATGQVFNGTSDFLLADGQPALFIFSTEDGTIVAWDAGSGVNAQMKADRSGFPTPAAGAVYKGLAIGTNSSGNFLYATNFRTGTVDVYDKNFAITNLAGSFTDPSLPAGYAPFGIRNIGGDLYVTYAKQDATKHDDVEGAGNGVINVFDTNGVLKRRFATGSGVGGTATTLDSPWGLTVAPATFGGAGGALLVGNFGDGRISAFTLSNGNFLGQLKDSTGAQPLSIPGLWSLTFGNGGAAGSVNTLFFTAGIGDPPTFTNNIEQHGLFGSLQPLP